MGYEEDLGDAGENEEKKQIDLALKQSTAGGKNKKKKVEEPEEIIVISLADQFNGYFTTVQVRDTLIANKLDIDKSMASLKQRHDQAIKTGKTNNIKKQIYDKVQKQKEEEKQRQDALDAEREFNRKMNQNVERENDFFHQEDHATLN